MFVNQKIYRLARKTFLGFHPHRLSLEVTSVLNRDDEASETIGSVQLTMKSAKKS